MSKQDVAKEAESKLDASLRSQGRPPLPPITCPDDLKVKIGATTRCFAKGDFGRGQSGTLGITVRVTAVHGSRADLNFDTDSRLTK